MILFNIGAAILSFVPSILLYLWLRNKVRQPQTDEYHKAIGNAMKQGCLTVLPVILCSAVFALIGALLKWNRNTSIFGAFYHTFFVLALSEEISKTFMFTKVLKKAEYSYTGLDITIFMTIVAMGFGLLEDVVYTIGSNAIQILIRGVLMMHTGWGFLSGLFYASYARTGKKWQAVLGFLIPWILHGSYDFGLSSILSEEWAILPVAIAASSFVILIVMIIYFACKQKEAPQEPVSKEPENQELSK